ncbi:MAG: hydrolase [Parachlamydiaceae bacterium]|nr:hydrolase [Parachlamydiaceae bacterium]
MNQYLPYLEWISNQQEIMTESVKRWAAINSWSDNINGLQQMASTLSKEFECLESEIKLHPLPLQKIINAQGQFVTRPLGKAISIKKRPNAKIQILLAGHMDTVYPPTDPFQNVIQKGENLHGPGVADMKGGLVILLTTLQALERSPFASSIGWEVIINPDEEIGSPGSYSLYQEAAKRNDVGLIFEPSFSDGAFVSARKGSANYSIVVKGKSAHAGRDFHQGRSAIYAISHFIHMLEKLPKDLPTTTINVGYIQGGSVPNIVPDLSVCRLNVRSNTANEMIKTRQYIDELILDCERREGIQFTLIEDSNRLPKPFDAKTEFLFNAYQKCVEDTDNRFELRESGGVCDGNILSAEGLPTIDSVGAIGGNIHTENEYLFLPSLSERARIAALFLFKCSTGEIAIAERSNKNASS